MTRTLRTRLMACAAVLVAVLVPRPAPAQPVAWPDFALTRLADGQGVRSGALVSNEPTLVVLVRPACEPCRDVVRRVAAGWRPGQRGRVAVVLSGLNAAEVLAIRTAAAGLPASAWYADDIGAAMGALGNPSLPAVLGVRGSRIVWTLRGSLFIDAQWQGVVLPWLR
jgi:hypothetical protein